MTKIYVNGKRVTKEALVKIEIRSEKIKRILSDKLTNGEKSSKMAV